jgi:hypothetical protein
MGTELAAWTGRLPRRAIRAPSLRVLAKGMGGRVVILRVHDPRRGLSLKQKKTTVRELEEG